MEVLLSTSLESGMQGLRMDVRLPFRASGRRGVVP